MSQEFRPHSVINYKASSDGVVRHRRLKKSVRWKNNMGYLIFNTGEKCYLCHRIIYEAYNGLIKDGFVIDHIDSNRLNNSLDYLRPVTQSENNASGKTGKHAKNAISVKSFDTVNNEEKIFQSLKLVNTVILVERQYEK